METALTKQANTVGATLLITGCCIGVGMIGLPVISAMTGLIPTTFAMILCYIFSTVTGLLILEATLWFNSQVNLITMAGFTLGRMGKAITWLLFCFLYYCLLIAYIDGGGQLISNVISFIFNASISREIGIICCVSFVGLIVYGKTKMVSYVSKIFLFCLAFSFCALLSAGIPHVDSKKLLYADWGSVYSTLPILLVCFGYQSLIPTLTEYVKRDIQSLRIAIFVGNFIPLLIYFVWNMVILGILPDGKSDALAHIVSQSDMVTGLLEKASESNSIVFFAKTFSLFAILTPFMANTMSFVDFLRDGLAIPKTYRIVYPLVLIPPTVLTVFFPHLFLKALGYAGGFADVVLFGILPIAIVWIGRYVKQIVGPFTTPGGKPLLIAMLLFSICLLLIRN